MHTEILNEEQLNLLPFVQTFKSKFYLVGGTAIALQIGHRESIDFDLFTEKNFSTTLIHKKISSNFKQFKLLHKSDDQVHYIINGVKITFFQYPYKIIPSVKFDKVILLPDLLTLSAMKAFALGRRAKWKDYVDLYFLLKNYFSLSEISEKAKYLFEDEFSIKLFRQQISYFEDIDYREDVVFKKGFEVSEEEVKDFLVEIATREF